MSNPRCVPLCFLVIWACFWASGAWAQPIHIRYAVSFHGVSVATQTITIEREPERTILATEFDIPDSSPSGLPAQSESLRVTFRADGTVEQLHSVRIQDGRRSEVIGEIEEEEFLQLIRTDPDGIETQTVARADYDFHSLILYGTAPRDFLPDHRPVRVFCLADGRIHDCEIRSISQAETTRERQHIASLQLTWTCGPHTGRTQHPDRPDRLPSRITRDTPHGPLVFTLHR